MPLFVGVCDIKRSPARRSVLFVLIPLSTGCPPPKRSQLFVLFSPRGPLTKCKQSHAETPCSAGRKNNRKFWNTPQGNDQKWSCRHVILRGDRNYIHDERPWTEQKSQFGQNAFAFGQEQEIEEDATFDTSVNGTSLWVQKTWCWLEKQSKNNNKRYVLLQFPHLFCSRGRLEQHRNPPPQKFSLEFFRKKEPSIFTFYCARSGQTRFYCCVVLFLYLTLKTFQQSNA